MSESLKIEEALSTWTSIENQAALREGWCLSVNSGSKLSIQCQKIDDPETATTEEGFQVPDLGTDDDAMRFMYHGQESHHQLARKILQKSSPDEWQLILKAVTENRNFTGQSKIEILRRFGYDVSACGDQFKAVLVADPEAFTLVVNSEGEAIAEAYKFLQDEVDPEIGYVFPS